MEERSQAAAAAAPGYGGPASSRSCVNFDASFWTAENFRHASHKTVNAIPDDCTRWTNEKHNQYLDTLEASFVKQLYQSTSLSRCSEQNKYNKNLTKELPSRMEKVSAQFPVLQDFCRNKINNERDQLALYNVTPSSDDQQLYEADICKCLKLHCDKKCLRTKQTFPSGVATRSAILPASHTDLHDLVGSMTEGSGQNFEEGWEENAGSKRRETAGGGKSSHEILDQIVPSGKFDDPTTIALSAPKLT